jgi:Coenzyme PQQ synthesis protein D (PqqD)
MTEILEPVMAEQSIDLNAPVEASHGLRGLEIDDELVVIDLLADRSFRLNSTGRMIWAHLQERSTLRDIVDTFEREYGLGREEAAEIVVDYVERLEELGIAAIQRESIAYE